MANVSNYGLIGVGSGIQFGKGGTHLNNNSGTFNFKQSDNSTDAALAAAGVTSSAGNITLTTGNLVVGSDSGTLVLGTASDTTLSRQQAGVFQFNGNGAILLPTDTATFAGTPAAGMFRYNSGSLEYYNGSWTTLATGGVAVTSISIVSANGLAGTSSGGTSPALTLSTTVTGVLKGNGNAISAAVPGTDYLTVLSGDVTTSGNVATLATVNTNVGTFGSSTSIPTFTVNGKGLVTAASGNVVIAPAGTLTGTTLASNVVSSSLTSVGTIATGTWNGTTIAIANGGTGQTTKSTAFNALAPTTTEGDIIYYSGGTNTRLAIGTSGQALVVSSGDPTWANVVNSITGSTGITPSSGTGAVTLNLSTNLVALSGLTSTPGFVVETAAGVFTTRSITGTAGDIVVTFGDGVSNSPTIDLATVTQGSGSSFVKITLDGFGRVTGNTAVSQSDLTSVLGTYYLPEAGGSMTGNITMTSGATVTGLPTPVNGSDAANKSYVDSAVNGLSWKEAVIVATTANITLSGEQTIDGVLTSASRVLVKNQTDQTTNGIYVSAAGSWTRSADANTGASLNGAAVFVEEGTSQASTGWVQTTDPVTLGTSNIVWFQFSGAGSYAAGSGLTLTGNTFAVNYGAGLTSVPTGEVGVNLYSSSGALLLTTDGTTQNPIAGSSLALLLKSAGGLTQDTTGLYIPAAGVTNAMLANNSFTLDGGSGTGSVALGGSLSVNGTSGQIDTVVSGSTVTVSIDAGYLGQTSITTLGTISTGTWHGSVVGTTYGGTGLNTSGATDGQLLIGNGAGGFNLNTLTSGAGISITDGAGTITVANTGVTSFSGGTTGLTPATATTGVVTLAGTLATANGGTGLTTFVANEVFYAGSSSTVSQSANFTFDGTSSLTLSGAAPLVINGANASITATATNGSITLNPNGSGSVVIGPTGASGFIASKSSFGLTVTGDTGLTLGTTTSGNVVFTLGASSDYLNISSAAGNPTATQYATNVTGQANAIPNVQYVTNAIAAATGGEGSIQSVSATISLATTGQFNIGSVLPATATVLSVKVMVTSVDTGSGTLSVGVAGNAAFMSTTENNLQISGLYVAECYVASQGGNQVSATIAGTPASGSAVVFVTYAA